MTEEVYLMTIDGEYLQCINEDGFIELSDNPRNATPFYGPDEDNDLVEYRDGTWDYKGELLTKLTERQIDAIRGLCDRKTKEKGERLMEKTHAYNIKFIVTDISAKDANEAVEKAIEKVTKNECYLKIEKNS